MNCCDHNSNDSNGNDKKNKHAHKGHMSHMWMMALCCGAPLILLFVVFLFGASFPALKVGLISVLPFICPIMMIGMIPMMLRKDKHDDNCHDGTQNEKQEELKQ